MKITQRIVIGQNNATKECKYISGLIDGYTEKGSNPQKDRIVVHYLKSIILINYLKMHKLRSIKVKSFRSYVKQLTMHCHV